MVVTIGYFMVEAIDCFIVELTVTMEEEMEIFIMYIYVFYVCILGTEDDIQ